MPKRRHDVRVGKLQLAAACAIWQSNKDVQEDRFILDIECTSSDGHLVAGFAVLDGHSGSLCVDHVVDRLPKVLQRCLAAKPKLSDENLSKAVVEACAQTDEEFLKKARITEILDGSTMVLCLVYPNGNNYKLLTACIGDSRAVLCRTGNSAVGSHELMAIPLSEDHKPNRPDEIERINSHGGIVDFEGVWRVFMPGPAKFGGQIMARWGLAVSRAFGDLLLKEAERFECAGVLPGGLVISTPEVRILDLQPSVDQFLVLASDGVWDVMSNEDAIALVASQPSVDIAAQRLLRHTYASNTDDNITAVVLTWKAVA